MGTTFRKGKTFRMILWLETKTIIKYSAIQIIEIQGKVVGFSKRFCTASNFYDRRFIFSISDKKLFF
jgi:hypothetical protein